MVAVVFGCCVGCYGGGFGVCLASLWVVCVGCGVCVVLGGWCGRGGKWREQVDRGDRAGSVRLGAKAPGGYRWIFSRSCHSPIGRFIGELAEQLADRPAGGRLRPRMRPNRSARSPGEAVSGRSEGLDGGRGKSADVVRPRRCVRSCVALV